jgi:LPS sulfotransferase NodH
MTIDAFRHKKAVVSIGPDFVAKSANESSFLCLPKELPKDPVHLHPFVVFAEPRSGSNLLFDMLHKRDIVMESSASHSRDVEIFPLHELFADYTHEYWRHKKSIWQKAAKTCLVEDLQFPLNEKVLASKMTKNNSVVLDEIEQVLAARQKNPKEVFDLLYRLPSFADQGYYAFKLFSAHVKTETFGSPLAVVEMVRKHDPGTKFAILWRRRMIESFVSYTMAVSTGAWSVTDKNTRTPPESIHLEKEEIDAFVTAQRQYYLSVKQALETEGVEYTVFEYSRDLLDSSSQLKSIQRLEQMLGGQGASLANETMSLLALKKQQESDLSDIVENWNDVIAWGYGADAEAWEDLFA